jgi:acetoin utilization protein AcuB
MLVKDWMSKQLIVLDVKDSVQEAIVRLREHDINKLPVLDGGNLVGMVTDEDLRRFWPSAASNTVEIKDLVYMALNTSVDLIMTKDPITVPFNYTLQETAEVLLKNNISGCPVVDDQGKVLGMITRNDLFKAMISWSGIREDGIQVGVLVEDQPGCIRKITDSIRRHGGRIAGILSSIENAPEGFRNVSIAAYDVDQEGIQRIKHELNERARILFLVNRQGNSREVFSKE